MKELHSILHAALPARIFGGGVTMLCLMSSLMFMPGRGTGQPVFNDDFQVFDCPDLPCTSGYITNEPECLPTWFISHGTPHVRQDNFPAPNRALCMTYNEENRGEDVFRTLQGGAQFLACNVYVLEFRMRTLGMPNAGDASYQIALTNGLAAAPVILPDPPCAGVIPQPSPIQIIFSQPATNFPVSAGWQYFSCRFVPNQNFSQLWVTATTTGVQGNVVNMFCIDDISVTLEGIVEPATSHVSLSPNPMCPGETIELRYRICNAVGLSATTYTVQAGSFPVGFTLAPGSVNPAVVTIAGGACVANSNCMDAVFQIEVTPNQAPGNYTIPLSISLQSAHGCIGGWMDEVIIEVVYCPPPNFTCPCPASENIHIDATTLPGGEILLSDLINTGVLPSGMVSGQCIAIDGVLRVDVNYGFEDCEMRMQPGSGIIVGSHNKLRLDVVTRNGGVWGCEQMWKGIRVEDNATLISKNSNIADAQYAIWADDKSRVEILGSEFRRNYTGLYFQPILPGEFFMPIFHGNLFDGAQPLLAPFSGQTPAPGARPFAGVDVTGQSLLHIGVAGAAQPNTFRALRNGILTDNTQTVIENSIFENILRVNTEPNYPFTGFAMRHTGGAAHGLELHGLGMNPAAPATFHNCTNGVWATGTDVSVQQARMTGMTSGVAVRLATGRDIELKHNRISAAATGIYLEHNDPAQQIDVSENIINVAGGKSVGIRVVETNIGHDAAAITDNSINASEGARGMLLRTAKDYWIDGNTITLVFPDEISRGINMHGSKKCQVSNNAIQGAGNLPQLPQGIGIDVQDSDNIFYDCNTLHNLNTGARFGGECSGTELQATTFITPMRIGLHYLPGLTIDPQLHEGNQWLTTGGDFGEAAARNDIQNVQGIPIDVALAAQRYEVHSTAPPFYPPSFSFPNLNQDPLLLDFYRDVWFPLTQGTSDPCGAEPELLVGGGEEMRVRIAQGIGFESDYAANRLWQARRNIYDAIAAEAGSLSGAMQSFYQSNSAGLLGGLYAIEQGKREMYKLLPAVREQMDTYLAGMKQLAEEIAEQDSLLALEEGNLMLRQSLLQEFGMAVRAVDSLEQAIYAVRTVLADSLQISNSLLTANAIYESNAIQVNDLYLDKPARGLTDFSPAQIADLESIAEQCPAAGGRAVWQARSLLALAGWDHTYDDECDSMTNPALQMPGQFQAQDLDIQQKVATEVRVFPNPASSLVTVVLTPGVFATAQIRDMYGRVWLERSVRSEITGQIQLDVSRLSAGFYHLLLRDSEGDVHSISISIIH